MNIFISCLFFTFPREDIQPEKIVMVNGFPQMYSPEQRNKSWIKLKVEKNYFLSPSPRDTTFYSFAWKSENQIFLNLLVNFQAFFRCSGIVCFIFFFNFLLTSKLVKSLRLMTWMTTLLCLEPRICRWVSQELHSLASWFYNWRSAQL